RLLTSSSTPTGVRNYLEKRNVGGFGFIYGTLLLIPIFILNIKVLMGRRKIKSLGFLIIVSSLIFTVLIMSNFSTVYLILIIAILLSFLPSKKMYLTIPLTLIIAIVMYPLIIDSLVMILTFIKDVSSSVMTQRKMTSLIGVL